MIRYRVKGFPPELTDVQFRFEDESDAALSAWSNGGVQERMDDDGVTGLGVYYVDATAPDGATKICWRVTSDHSYLAMASLAEFDATSRTHLLALENPNLSGLATTQNVTDARDAVLGELDGLEVTATLGDVPAGQLADIYSHFQDLPDGPVYVVEAPNDPDQIVGWMITCDARGNPLPNTAIQFTLLTSNGTGHAFQPGTSETSDDAALLQLPFVKGGKYRAQASGRNKPHIDFDVPTEGESFAIPDLIC